MRGLSNGIHQYPMLYIGACIENICVWGQEEEDICLGAYEHSVTGG